MGKFIYASSLALVAVFLSLAIVFSSQELGNKFSPQVLGQFKENPTPTIFIPEGLPKDFPIFPQAVFSKKWKTEGLAGQGIEINWNLDSYPASEKDFSQLVSFYKENLDKQNWIVAMVEESSQETTLTFDRADSQGFLKISRFAISATFWIK